MGGGSKKETSTTVENRDPWAPAQNNLVQILNDSKYLYDNHVGSRVYDGDTTAGLGDTTEQGIAAIKSGASSTMSAADAAQDYMGQTMASGGIDPITGRALGQINRIGDTDLSGLQGAAAGVAAGPSASSNLRDVAEGKFLSGDNPYLNDLIADSASDAAGQVAAQFSAGGRYGGGSMGRAVADATGKIATQIRADQYDKERSRQVEAAGQIDATDLAREQARLGAQGAVVTADQANKTAATTRAGMAASIGQQGQSLVSSLIPQLETLSKVRSDQANSVLLGGSLEDAAAQAELDAAQAKWAAEQDAPFRNLGLYQAVAQPIGGMGYSGTSTTEKTTPAPSLGQSLLGGGLGALSIMGKAGLFGASDERIKENVEKVGELPNGLDLVEYDMKPEFGGGHQIGVLAQDVEKVNPDAVITGPDGIKRVNYDDATGGVMKEPVGLGRHRSTSAKAPPSRKGLAAHRKAA